MLIPDSGFLIIVNVQVKTIQIYIFGTYYMK